MYRFPMFFNTPSQPYSLHNAQGRLLLNGGPTMAAAIVARRAQARSQSIPTKTEALQRISQAKRSNPIIIALKGGLTKAALALKFFEENNINVLHIESRKCTENDASVGNAATEDASGDSRRASAVSHSRRTSEASYEVLVDLEYDHTKIDDLCAKLRRQLSIIHINGLPSPAAQNEPTQNEGETQGYKKKRSLVAQASIDSLASQAIEETPQEDELEVFGVPWFPRCLKDLDKTANRVLMYGAELDADHPGFTDEIYRKRRMLFARIASDFHFGQPIPRIKYSAEENATWGAVFGKLLKLYPDYACQQYLDNLNLLIQQGYYSTERIPQLQDLSNFLRSRTGFTLRPVAGYLSSRDFLAALSFRVFCCTQYIRHPADPFYSPEPDCCHELLGHVPLFADAGFAQFSQEIGLASLGASDDDVSKLATCYFFSVEFGLCRQRNQLRVYGAGLLSSANELQHALSDEAVIKPFEPSDMCTEECIVTTYQNNYFYTSSFDEAKSKMRAFAQTIRRPFGVRYNPYTQTVDVLHNEEVVQTLLNDLKSEMDMIAGVLRSVGTATAATTSETQAKNGSDNKVTAPQATFQRKASLAGTDGVKINFPLESTVEEEQQEQEQSANVPTNGIEEEEDEPEYEEEETANSDKKESSATTASAKTAPVSIMQ